MRFAGAPLAFALALAPLACGGGAAPPAPACAAWETRADDGSCVGPGVRASGCASGFTSDGQGGCGATMPATSCAAGAIAVPGDVACRPIGPADPPTCTPGTFALPGESSCHDLGDDCGAAPWGAIPVDGTTRYVDGAYAGGASDGTSARPWTHLADAAKAASAGDIVAIAAGHYAESLVVDKPLRLWGRCAALVTIETSAGSPAIWIAAGGAKSEVHQLALTGDGLGVRVDSGADGATLDRLWIHDLTGLGARARAASTLSRSLVESVGGIGVAISAAAVVLDHAAIRALHADAAGNVGLGVTVDGGGRAEVHASLVEQARSSGLLAVDGDALIEGSIVRETLPSEDGSVEGHGIDFQPGSTPRTLSVTGSLVERTQEIGILVFGKTIATIDATVVRGVRVGSSGYGGEGIAVQADDTGVPEVHVTGSLLEGNHFAGLYDRGGDVLVEGSVARGTGADATHAGHGFAARDDVATRPGTLTIRGSAIDSCRGSGITAIGTSLDVESTFVHDMLPDATGQTGYGISALGDTSPSLRGALTLRGSVIASCLSAGVSVSVADATLEDTVIRDTQHAPKTGMFGFAVVVGNPADSARSSLVMRRCLLASSSESGLVAVQSDATL